MFDFNKRLSQQQARDPRDPLTLFESLDRKASHTVLRAVQKEGLQELGERWDDPDIILKLSTGAGKTTIALAYLEARMRASNQPVVYLCPTTQLVSQVLSEANKLGVKAVPYPHGQKRPDVNAIRARAIIVCTYDKLFNAKTTFDRDDVSIAPDLIILDDAHAGIKEIRDSFTISAPSSGDIYRDLYRVLRPLCSEYTCMLEYIEREDKTASFEVPFWIWSELLDDVRRVLIKYKDIKPYCFVWGYLREHLRWCRCVVTAHGIDIVPDLPLVESVRAFKEANQRVYMSATLADDSILVRELGCSAQAALSPIVPSSDAGVGERMVLAPSLIDPKLDRAWVMSWCSRVSKTESVVVLASSELRAREWESVGAYVGLGADVEDTVIRLRNNNLKFAAFAQRYDGVDLPDDACRILVLDGMPTGQSFADNHDCDDRSRPGGTIETWIHRIEQGMGRAVRSHADYAVVILAGSEVAYFVSRSDVREHMGISTRAQIDLAHELTEMAKDPSLGVDSEIATHEMAFKCIRRDNGWKTFYDQKVRQVAKDTSISMELEILMAEAERESLDFAIAGESQRAADHLNLALNTWKQPIEREGWYLQRKANYTYATDPGKAFQIQLAAFRKNRRVCPPPKGIIPHTIDASKLKAPAIIQNWLGSFSQNNGPLAAFHSLKAKLSFDVNADRFEQGLEELADLIGAQGCRPEKLYRRGPDDMWSWFAQDWVIEAKNEAKGPLCKDYGEQMMSAVMWHNEFFPERECIPIVASRIPNPKWDSVFPKETRVLTPDTLSLLLKNVEQLLIKLADQAPQFLDLGLIRRAMQQHELEPGVFLTKYTVPMGKQMPRKSH